MFHIVTASLTAITMLAHAVLGCCWHHRHGADAYTAESECRDIQSGADSSTRAHVGCCHAGCRLHRKPSRGEKSETDISKVNNPSGQQNIAGASREQAPAPHSPCSEGRCRYVRLADSNLQSAGTTAKRWAESGERRVKSEERQLIREAEYVLRTLNSLSRPRAKNISQIWLI